ncbi:hypothetical protein [Xanthobacter versatilis]|uniref:hypothetical protein n=1 Tax=Xanthobacter autotrophicus (strain ATCC BAA-1158 / Py2) TaxID=78245 RepID=UPI0037283EE4
MDFVFPPTDDRPTSVWQPPEPAPADDFIRDVKVTAEAFEAGRAAATYIDNTIAWSYAREEAYDRRNKAIKAATGVDLPNPMRQPIDPIMGTARARELGLIPGVSSAAALDDALRADHVADYERRRRELADNPVNAEDPAILAAIAPGRPVDEDIRRTLIPEVERRTSEALAAPSSRPWLKWGGFLAGSVVGGFRDPVNLALLFFGGGPSTARTAGGAILKTGLREGTINADGELLTQPIIQKWRADMGLENGIGPAAQNVATAFGFGALVGGAVEGLGRAARANGVLGDGAPAAPRAPAGETIDMQPVGGVWREPAPRPDAPVIVRALAGDEEAMIAAAREGRDALDPATLAAAEALEADRLARAAAPEGVPEIDHEAAVAQAVRHAEDPAEPPPAPPQPVPPARGAEPVLADDAPSPVVRGRSFDYLGRPVSFEAQDAATLGTDAGAFQYKGGGDAAGVTDRLNSVSRWDDLASGKVVVFERADGSRVIADGHQRLGLAKRLLSEGAERRVTLDAYVFRAKDGWTPSEVRAVAAKKNLQEGSGDVIDTARILRERPDLLDGSVPTSSEHMRRARALARLSDDAFGMVLNRQIAPAHAASVGELVQDPALHAPIVAELAKVDDLSARQARLMVADLLSVPARREVQETLFGTLDALVPLVAERSRVLDAALGSLKRSKGLFRTLVSNADAIEQAGNQLAAAANVSAAEQAERAAALLELAAHRHGPVSQALDRAAVALSEGRPLAQVRDAFTAEVVELTDRHGLVALASMEPSPARVAMDSPVGAEAQAQVEALNSGLFGVLAPEPSAAKPQLHATPSPDAVLAAVMGQPHRTLDELYRAAPKHQADLVAAGKEIAGELGLTFKDPGLKKRATTEEKVVRKRYASVARLTDVVRAGAVVDTPEQADALARGLAARFEVFDEGWKATEVGYVDRKLLVRFDDGTMGEVQIWERNMLRAKDKGTALYTERRSLPADDPRRAELAMEETNLYSAARTTAEGDWAAVPVSDGNGGRVPYAGSNLARNSASEPTRYAYEASTGSTDAQASPGLNTTQADLRSSASSMGWNSQSKNRMEDPSKANIELDRPENNVPRANDPDGIDTNAATGETLAEEADRAADIAEGVAGCKPLRGPNGD